MNTPPTLRIAIIGCGSYAARHARYLSSRSDVNLDLVVDIDESRAAGFRRDYGAKRIATDAREVWSDPAIDAVWICTQHDTHAPLAEAAARAGKAFFLEKPLAITLEDCDRIVQAVERTGVTAAVGFKLRFFPAVKAARKFLTKPLLTMAHVIDDRWPDDAWSNDPVKGGGNLLSQGCHILDTVLFLHPAPPVRIYAAGGNLHHPHNDIVDIAAITLTFADGSVASVGVGDAGVPPHGSKFALQQSDGHRSFNLHDRLNALTTREDQKVTVHPPWPEEGAAVIDDEFIAAVAAGNPSPVSVHSARRTTAVVLAAVESIRAGRAIDFTDPPYAAALAVPE